MRSTKVNADLPNAKRVVAQVTRGLVGVARDMQGGKRLKQNQVQAAWKRYDADLRRLAYDLSKVSLNFYPTLKFRQAYEDFMFVLDNKVHPVASGQVPLYQDANFRQSYPLYVDSVVMRLVKFAREMNQVAQSAKSLHSKFHVITETAAWLTNREKEHKAMLRLVPKIMDIARKVKAGQPDFRQWNKVLTQLEGLAKENGSIHYDVVAPLKETFSALYAGGNWDRIPQYVGQIAKAAQMLGRHIRDEQRGMASAWRRVREGVPVRSLHSAPDLWYTGKQMTHSSEGKMMRVKGSWGTTAPVAAERLTEHLFMVGTGRDQVHYLSMAAKAARVLATTMSELAHAMEYADTEYSPLLIMGSKSLAVRIGKVATMLEKVNRSAARMDAKQLAKFANAITQRYRADFVQARTLGKQYRSL